jgi:hypothetical protein
MPCLHYVVATGAVATNPAYLSHTNNRVGPNMARYFFHVVGVTSTFRDESGQEFASLEGAKKHAGVIAGELAAEGEVYRGFTVCVVDALGTEVASVPIRAQHP